MHDQILCFYHFEIYLVHSPTNALFVNLVKSFEFTLKYTIISFLHVSVECRVGHSHCALHTTHKQPHHLIYIMT